MALGVSLDELAMGFSAGLRHISLVPLVLAIAIQTFIVTQAGVRVGTRLGERGREASERIAALALLALGIILTHALRTGPVDLKAVAEGPWLRPAAGSPMMAKWSHAPQVSPVSLPLVSPWRRSPQRVPAPRRTPE